MLRPQKKSPVLTKDDAKSILARSAVASFGWSAGRDLYKSSPYILMIGAAVAGTGIAIYDIRCTQRRYLFTNALIIIGSTLLTAFLLMITESGTAILVGTLLIQGVSALVGYLRAERDRGPLLHAQEIEESNWSFLDESGFRDVGGRHGTLLDPYGHELVLDDHRDDAMVFKIPGRRSVRAYIWLDDEGRTVGYEPPPGSGPPLERQAARAPVAEADTLDDEDWEGDSLSYPLDDDEAVLLLDSIDEDTLALLGAIVSQARGTIAGIPWAAAQEITGSRDWQHFARRTLSRLHRILREVTGDPNSVLVLDSDQLEIAREEGEPRLVLIQGPAVGALQRQFRQAEAFAARHHEWGME